jgi:hypothetical protein
LKTKQTPYQIRCLSGWPRGAFLIVSGSWGAVQGMSGSSFSFNGRNRTRTYDLRNMNSNPVNFQLSWKQGEKNRLAD